MKLFAFARLLNMKINSASKKAQNPFVNSGYSSNPFLGPAYTTLVWIEPDENMPSRFYK